MINKQNVKRFIRELKGDDSIAEFAKHMYRAQRILDLHKQKYFKNK
jgi:hypothetical protein